MVASSRIMLYGDGWVGYVFYVCLLLFFFPFSYPFNLCFCAL